MYMSRAAMPDGYHAEADFAPSSASVADSYSVAHDAINIEQSERLVKKAMNRKK